MQNLVPMYDDFLDTIWELSYNAEKVDAEVHEDNAEFSG